MTSPRYDLTFFRLSEDTQASHVVAGAEHADEAVLTVYPPNGTGKPEVLTYSLPSDNRRLEEALHQVAGQQVGDIAVA